MARYQRLPAAHEERPAAPHDDGCGENKLDPVRQGWVDPAVAANEMAAHLQHHRRHGQRKPDPEAPRHVREFGIGRRVEAHDIRLQRHAADRAASGADLPDLGMHRAGVDRTFRHGGFCRLLLEIGLGIGGKFGFAAGRTEVESFATVVESVLAIGGIDHHAANGIAHRGIGLMPMMSMVGLVIMAATAASRRGRFSSNRSSFGAAAATRFRCGADRIGLAVRILVVVAHRIFRALQPIPCRGI